MIIVLVFMTQAPAIAVLCDCGNGETTIESVFDLCCSEENTSPLSNSAPSPLTDSESQPDDPCRDEPLNIITRVDSSEDTQEILKTQSLIFIADLSADLSGRLILCGHSVTRAPCPFPHTPLSSIILLL